MRRSSLIALLASSLFVLAGCKTQCRVLSERLCECLEPVEREDCLTLAASEERRLEPTAEQEEVCEGYLTTCLPNVSELEGQEREAACRVLETPEGKQACGLAR
jgi:hypothetical protein